MESRQAPSRITVRELRTAGFASLGPALMAAAFAVAVALLLRYLFAVPTAAELFADQATIRIPLNIFDTLLTTFGSNAKHLYLIGALVAEAALLALAGVAYVLVRAAYLQARRGSRPSGDFTLLTYREAPLILVWLLAVGELLLAPAVGGGFFGMTMSVGIGPVLVSLVAPALVFALSFVWWGLAEARSRQTAHYADSADVATVSRRAVLRQGALAILTLGGAIALWEALTAGLGASLGAAPPSSTAPSLSLSNVPERITPPPVPEYSQWPSPAGLSAEVTPANSFYYVSKNLAGDPNIDASMWSLTIDGLVSRPYSLTYAKLRSLPAVTQYHTLECISNEVGGNLMSNGFFTGTRLADLLNAAGIRPGSSEMIFHAADGYSDSIHLSQALDDQSLIVYLLNGQPLPPAHGFPARMLVPGYYGMKNGKWLTGLTVDAGSYTGYWEQRGWTSEPVVKMTARIDTPHDGDLLVSRQTFIAGVAYSGDQGIARVDVSVDGGRTWQAARLRKPLGALTWTLWEAPWEPEPGIYTVVARSIDLAGRVQTPAIASPLPNGSSGYHAISVTVR